MIYYRSVSEKHGLLEYFLSSDTPLVRYLPDWCPGTGFKDVAREMRKNFFRSAEQPYNWVKEQMRNKKAKTSFLSQAIEFLGTEASMEDVHRWSAVSMYLGGSDTTVSAIMDFFLAMAIFPDVQKKAQEELDRVIGGDRLPTISDKASLPYIEAMVKETHRWHPVAPMALPHCPLEEDSINGYRIPKGALIMTNIWYVPHLLLYTGFFLILYIIGGSPTTLPHTQTQ